MELIKNYQEALQAVYDHVGLEEDWVVCPLDDRTEMVWGLTDDSVYYAKKIEDFDGGDYYQDDIYTQRFYPKHVYRGEDFTLVFCDPHVDGMKWWRLFDNKKELTEEQLEELEV